jgi:hypothetical protein
VRGNRRLLVALLLLLALPIAASLQAQEAIRLSMAGADAAQARHDAISKPGYYNLQVGQTLWRFGAGLGLQYNDNVTFVQNGKEGDFIYIPSVNTELLWPISDKQSLNLTVGAGYAGYVQHSVFDHFFITPNSDLSFDFYAGDFVINLHDRFTITQNSYQDPTIAAGGGYSRLQNNLGFSTLWDLNKVVVKFGYDHSSFIELSGGLGVPDQTSDFFSSSAGYRLRPGMLLGLEAGGGLLQYSPTNIYIPYSEATEWNIGSFFQSQVSEHLSLNAHAGYTVLSPLANGASPAATGFSGVYVELDVTHQLNRFLDYTLSAGRNLSTSLGGGSADVYSVNLSANWKFFQKVSIVTSFLYQQGTILTSSGGTFEQFGPQITVGRMITKHLSTSLAYQFYWRSSGSTGGDYTLNLVTLGGTWQF